MDTQSNPRRRKKTIKKTVNMSLNTTTTPSDHNLPSFPTTPTRTSVTESSASTKSFQFDAGSVVQQPPLTLKPGLTSRPPLQQNLYPNLPPMPPVMSSEALDDDYVSSMRNANVFLTSSPTSPSSLGLATPVNHGKSQSSLSPSLFHLQSSPPSLSFSPGQFDSDLSAAFGGPLSPRQFTKTSSSVEPPKTPTRESNKLPMSYNESKSAYSPQTPTTVSRRKNKVTFSNVESHLRSSITVSQDNSTGMNDPNVLASPTIQALLDSAEVHATQSISSTQFRHSSEPNSGMNDPFQNHTSPSTPRKTFSSIMQSSPLYPSFYSSPVMAIPSSDTAGISNIASHDIFSSPSSSSRPGQASLFSASPSRDEFLDSLSGGYINEKIPNSSIVAGVSRGKDDDGKPRPPATRPILIKAFAGIERPNFEAVARAREDWKIKSRKNRKQAELNRHVYKQPQAGNASTNTSTPIPDLHTHKTAHTPSPNSKSHSMISSDSPLKQQVIFKTPSTPMTPPVVKKRNSQGRKVTPTSSSKSSPHSDINASQKPTTPIKFRFYNNPKHTSTFTPDSYARNQLHQLKFGDSSPNIGPKLSFLHPTLHPPGALKPTTQSLQKRENKASKKEQCENNLPDPKTPTKNQLWKTDGATVLKAPRTTGHQRHSKFQEMEFNSSRKISLNISENGQAVIKEELTHANIIKNPSTSPSKRKFHEIKKLNQSKNSQIKPPVSSYKQPENSVPQYQTDFYDSDDNSSSSSDSSFDILDADPNQEDLFKAVERLHKSDTPPDVQKSLSLSSYSPNSSMQGEYIIPDDPFGFPFGPRLEGRARMEAFPAPKFTTPSSSPSRHTKKKTLLNGFNTEPKGMMRQRQPSDIHHDISPSDEKELSRSTRPLFFSNSPKSRNSNKLKPTSLDSMFPDLHNTNYKQMSSMRKSNLNSSNFEKESSLHDDSGTPTKKPRRQFVSDRNRNIRQNKMLGLVEVHDKVNPTTPLTTLQTPTPPTSTSAIKGINNSTDPGSRISARQTAVPNADEYSEVETDLEERGSSPLLSSKVLKNIRETRSKLSKLKDFKMALSNTGSGSYH